jgi:hypothetical protein
MNCAALTVHLLGRRYWVWTPHRLFRRLVQEPGTCRIDVSALLESGPGTLGPAGAHLVAACPACSSGAPRPPGAAKPFCLQCGRDLRPAPCARTSRPAGIEPGGSGSEREHYRTARTGHDAGR